MILCRETRPPGVPAGVGTPFVEDIGLSCWPCVVCVVCDVGVVVVGVAVIVNYPTGGLFGVLVC